MSIEKSIDEEPPPNSYTSLSLHSSLASLSPSSILRRRPLRSAIISRHIAVPLKVSFRARVGVRLAVARHVPRARGSRA